MLIEFSIANFRSIKERQTLSLVAGSSPSVRKTKSIATGLKAAPYLLRSAAIFGANAAGKSTVIEAAAFLKSFVLGSFSEEPGNPVKGYNPYRLSPETRTAPTEAEIVFTVDQNIYELGFRVDAKRVWAEWLYFTPKGGRRVKWINREYDPETETDNIIISASLSGPKSAWKASTRSEALVLSTAVALNSAELRQPYNWIKRNLLVISNIDELNPFLAPMKAVEQDDMRVLSLINNLDIDIIGLDIEEKNFSDLEIYKTLPPEMKEELKNAKSADIYCRHIDEEDDEILFNFEEESDGTRALIKLAAPLIDAADEGMTLFIDEIHNSLHPIAFRYLLEHYATDAIGKKGGQIVFTTHDTNSMDDAVLHRDQIWLAKRGTRGGTKLTPLSDFESARTNEPYRIGYLRGRYGGIPIVTKVQRGAKEPAEKLDERQITEPT